MDGETLGDYRRRLSTKIKVHSPTWKGFDLDKITDDAGLDPIETQIIDHAMQYARRPSNDTDELRMVKKTTDAGHTLIEFYGRPANWMDGFAGARQRATGSFKDGR
jgi:hypothetical protein